MRGGEGRLADGSGHPRGTRVVRVAGGAVVRLAKWYSVIRQIGQDSSVPRDFFAVVLHAVKQSDGRGRGQAAYIADNLTCYLRCPSLESIPHPRRQFSALVIRNGDSQSLRSASRWRWTTSCPPSRPSGTPPSSRVQQRAGSDGVRERTRRNDH
jgi:hypothetical protein